MTNWAVFECACTGLFVDGFYLYAGFYSVYPRDVAVFGHASLGAVNGRFKITSADIGFAYRANVTSKISRT